MKNVSKRVKEIFVFFIGCLFLSPIFAAELTHTIEEIKPSIVGIGTFQKNRSPALNFVGTGFAVGDGTSVITNAHVVNNIIKSENQEIFGVLVKKGDSADFRPATVVAVDTEHDLALITISGSPLPAMKLGDSGTVMEGQAVAFTGFPLGMVLGLHPVTHHAIVSAITPIVQPAQDSGKLNVNIIAQLRRAPFLIFQLDGTAYPGNSGSPLYDPASGIVYGVINMVFVKGLKENVLANPSGISYAIPSKFIHDLLLKK